MGDFLSTPVEYLKGVGPSRSGLLKKELGIFTCQDLLNLFPNRYIDRTRYYKIAELRPQMAGEVQIAGKITAVRTIDQKGKGKRLSAVFVDGTAEMELVWFQGIRWQLENLKVNTPVVIFGKINYFNGNFSMVHPDIEPLAEHTQNRRPALQPVYPSTEALTAKGMTNRAMGKIIQQVIAEGSPEFEEPLPIRLLHQLELPSKTQAMREVHFPRSLEHVEKARFRLKFEELFFIQIQLVLKNLTRKHKIRGHVFKNVGHRFTDFYENHLPFGLTDAQKRVIREIRHDMGQPAQMNRLLQGDVGSGKTIVAFMSMLLAIDNGFQACLMAPTEILAAQHFNGLRALADPLGISIRLLTGSTKTADRNLIHGELENGSLHILIGTHALLEEKVRFHNLGLAIIDEQHRFGVEQRSRLWKKNDIPPHVLVMTATPIPRTLAMSLYGDLDISVIDQMPPGRKPIQTVHRFDSNRLRVWKFLKDEIARGRQVYIVYPLISESEKMDYKDLMDGYESISRDFPLPDYSISILHGKMKPAEKDAEMARFAQGKTNIMVATTVIEVGVNVPNASVMVIESAERFGLSQLHQLRGRVGRGAEQSYCILMTGHKLSNDSKIRMETMVRTNDGFEIAETDLKLRGPGDLMGTQQSGILNLRIADLVRDRDILQLTREHALALLADDPTLSRDANLPVRIALDEMFRKKNIWNHIS